MAVCYLKSFTRSDINILLPHDVPVLVGRMPELQISDKTCSRNQLEVRANCEKQYVLVKRLGNNLSHIDGIAIQKNVSSQLKAGQQLCIVNMKYPHFVEFVSTDSNKSLVQSSKHSSSQKCGSLTATKCKRKRTKLQSDGASAKISKTLPSDVDESRTKYLEYQFNSPSPKKESGKYLKSDDITSKSSLSHWSQGLKSSMSDPNSVIFEDQFVVAIKDKYPKARYHWLVLPLKDISNPYKLALDDVDLVKHMLKVGKSLAISQTKEDNTLLFRYGYHAVASMSHLHMHVISQEFSSPCLKTKKHWNSFTTDYFVDAEDVIRDLEEEGKVKDRKSLTELLKKPLRCHRCDESLKNMPALKQHIASCDGT